MSAPARDNIFKHAAVAFVIALAGYVFFFACDARLRTRRGPWIVEFASSTKQQPLLTINQPRLNIRNVRILIEGETFTNAPALKAFDNPADLAVPFGRVRFHDLTYLPGTITLDVFGHEIELIPRALFLNTKEKPWSNDQLIILTVTNKIPGLKDRDRKGRR